MEWGSFVVGFFVGGLFFGFIGFVVGGLFSIIYKLSQEAVGAQNPFGGIIKPLDQGHSIYGEFYFCAKEPNKNDDDDGESPDPAPKFSLDSMRN